MGRHLAGAADPELREIVELKIYADLTFREISEVTGLPQGTVATRYRSALEKMRGPDGEGVGMNDDIERRLRQRHAPGAPPELRPRVLAAVADAAATRPLPPPPVAARRPRGRRGCARQPGVELPG